MTLYFIQKREEEKAVVSLLPRFTDRLSDLANETHTHKKEGVRMADERKKVLRKSCILSWSLDKFDSRGEGTGGGSRPLFKSPTLPLEKYSFSNHFCFGP